MALNSILKRNLMRIWRTRQRMTKSGWVPGALHMTQLPPPPPTMVPMACVSHTASLHLPFTCLTPWPTLLTQTRRTQERMRTVNLAPREPALCPFPDPTKASCSPTVLGKDRLWGDDGRAQAGKTSGWHPGYQSSASVSPSVKCRGQTR